MMVPPISTKYSHFRKEKSSPVLGDLPDVVVDPPPPPVEGESDEELLELLLLELELEELPSL